MGSASNGLSSKKFAWDWNAVGTNQETFDTEFATSNTASHVYNTPGNYKIRLIARDGNDNPFSGSRGGHYAVSVTKTVHVVDAAPVASVEISPSSATLDPGFTVLLDAILRDASGNILTGRTVNWTTSNAAVVTVPSQGDPVTATAQGSGNATITATSEGVSGYAAISVNSPADDAAAAGNTLPASIINGDFVSVTISMENTGGTTWTSAATYQLLVSQGYQYWVPGIDLLTSSVNPGATHTFALDLGLDDPYHTGNTACYHQMAHAGYFFGEENGRYINVIDGNFLSGESAASMATQSMMEEAADPQSWLVGARATKPMRFGPGTRILGPGEAQLLTYRYQHASPRTIDVVFQIVVDPTRAEILSPQVESGGTSLGWQVASVSPGEYWVRLTGTVSAGAGSIGSFPVRVRPQGAASGVLGSVTLHYPDN
jgi:hypothetical protein